MAKLALYQKYRSSTFEEVVGQEYVVRSIQNAIKEQKVGHAYLFCGPRGTGKTTMARLLAKAVNCTDPEHAPCGVCENCVAANNGTHPDIIEINAANETHVEDIRDLIERSRLAPMQGKHKIYIIDEVHQLSSAASSALLKTLEEPPENVIFILATTDPQKLLPTIISRCQRFDFTRVKKEQIKDHLLNIAEKENIEMEPEAAEMIAVLCDGGMRDALSIMDQCASFTSDHITAEAIDRIYGLATTDEKCDLLQDIMAGRIESLIQRIWKYEEQGIDLSRFTDGCVDILKDAVIYKETKNEKLLKVLNASKAAELGTDQTSSSLMRMTEEMMKAKDRFRLASSAASCFEVCCLKLASGEPEAIPVQKIVQVQNPAPTARPAPASTAAYTAPVPSANVAAAVNKAEPEAKKEVKPVPVKKEENVSYSTEDILSILVQCNKESKQTDTAAFNGLNSMMDLSSRKYAAQLESCVIAASGKDCILLAAGSSAEANRINSLSMNQELYRFVKDKLNTDKMLYAVTKDEFRSAAKEFSVRMKNGSLPEARVIERYSFEEKREPTSEEKVMALFGKENVDVV